MNGLAAIFKRELAGYFATPLAYVFIVIFLILTGVFTFQLGALYESNQADLRAFFDWHPWLYLFLIPAISMRLWAEERRSGTIELLMTLPITLGGAVLGKFLAAWVFAGIALILTFPVWITVNYLGRPDNGVIIAGYIGSWLMAGGFLAIGGCISAITKSQVIAFVLSVVVCFGFLLAGMAPVLDLFSGWAPDSVVGAISGFSFLTRFSSVGKGVIQLGDIVFFLSLIGVCLAANGIIVELKKSA
jgi:ABC-2 type transport system permease protein